MPGRVAPEVYAKFDALIALGWSPAAAAREVGITNKTAYLRVKGLKARDGRRYAKLVDESTLPDPKNLDRAKLKAEARAALTDFELFRLRYFGHVSTPWQVEAAYAMVEWLESDDKEFVVVNCPPGAGKSTLFTHDIPAWALVRNRSTRVLIGSRTERQARQYVGRLKTTFERTYPPTASDLDKKKGLAVDAVATLTGDYGRFKPTNPDVWRNEEFTIAQVNDIAGSDKERSVSAYGMDGGFLGGRYDLVIWDDLVDKRSMRTADAREALINMWETEAETRLEPGGLLILQGQRMRSDDLYRYALDLRAGDPDDYAEDELRPAKYRHVIYKAHDDDDCKMLHAKSDPAWRSDGTGGCLLDPVRLDRRSLKTIEGNKAERYRVMYQQEDVDPADAIIDRLWVYGGTDPRTNIDYPGCLDRERGLWEIPKMAGSWFVAVTCDPSPTKYNSVQLWAVHLPTEQRFLVAHERGKFDVNALLANHVGTTDFTGILVDWHERASAMGIPFTHVIFEVNAAQRYFLDSPSFKTWASMTGVRGVRHTTAANKVDAEYGLQSIAGVYEHGQVRLPYYGRDAQHASLKLIDEALKYPMGTTTDCLMAQWFLEYNLPKLRDRDKTVYRLRGSSYMTRRAQREMPTVLKAV